MGFSLPHLLLILLAVFLVFGTAKLPKAMEDIAKGIKGFKQALKDEKTTEQVEHQKEIVVNPQNDKNS